MGIFLQNPQISYPINTGCPKSSCANVRAYCSAAIGPMRIIRSGMSCIFHSFEESIKWNINIVHFLMNFVHFRCFRASEDMGSHSFEVHCVWRLKVHLSWKNGISSYSDDGDIKHYACVHCVILGNSWCLNNSVISTPFPIIFFRVSSPFQEL